ncbi:MAG: thioredoxin family protein [Alphaproteobacteria bacterium]|nr:thioredoxin family protein [Alphaproteobacteria bacterium]
MIEVRIYCIKSNENYQTSYNLIKETMEENNLEYIIHRITESDFIKRRNIIHIPHIVINNQITNIGKNLTKNEIRITLIRMKLL